MQSQHPLVVGLGGGRGLMHVTLPAFRQLGWHPILAVTTFGTGGSSRLIKQALEPVFGYTFSIGNLAAAYQQALEEPKLEAIFGHRLNKDNKRTLTEVVTTVIGKSLDDKSIKPSAKATIDRLRQLAPTIDEDLQGGCFGMPVSLKEHSLRNIIVLWHFLHSHVFRSRDKVSHTALRRALGELQKFFGLRSISILPISTEPGIAQAHYQAPVSTKALRKINADPLIYSKDRRVIRDEYALDNLYGAPPIVDFSLSKLDHQGSSPCAYLSVIKALQKASFVVAGGGSFYTSILINLGAIGIADQLLQRSEIPRVLILNPYHLDQTVGHSVLDFVQATERLADRVVSHEMKNSFGGHISFEHLFSDIIINDFNACPREAQSRFMTLMDQSADEGEARGVIFLKPQEKKILASRGIRVHAAHLVTVQTKDFKMPGGKVFQIAGYQASKIAPIFHDIWSNYSSR